jgi:DNA-binding XRE family transcriptional regulator
METIMTKLSKPDPAKPGKTTTPPRTRAADKFTPERLREIKAIQERSRHDRPGPDELIDRGEIDELVPHAQLLTLRVLMHQLRKRREAAGLSLTDVAERSGLTRAAISRLENGWNINPTLETLFGYAAAVGARLSLSSD